MPLIEPPKKLSLPLVALVMANLIPIVGVLFAGWSVLSVMLVFVGESLIIGLYNIAKMLTAQSSSEVAQPRLPKRLFLIAFFSIHYGGFCFVHAKIVVSLLGNGWEKSLNTVADLFQLFVSDMWLPLFCLMISHGISFVLNYLRRGEYRAIGVKNLLVLPYKRVFIMHAAVILGSVLVVKLNSPIWLVCMLVLLKLVIDILQHNKAHSSFVSTKIKQF